MAYYTCMRRGGRTQVKSTVKIRFIVTILIGVTRIETLRKKRVRHPTNPSKQVQYPVSRTCNHFPFDDKHRRVVVATAHNKEASNFQPPKCGETHGFSSTSHLSRAAFVNTNVLLADNASNRNSGKQVWTVGSERLIESRGSGYQDAGQLLHNKAACTRVNRTEPVGLGSLPEPIAGVHGVMGNRGYTVRFCRKLCPPSRLVEQYLLALGFSAATKEKLVWHRAQSAS
jgi:hypothetical protein